ncbi:MAG: pentapeptide repeat-containing protein [Acidobacteriota bacterium]
MSEETQLRNDKPADYEGEERSLQSQLDDLKAELIAQDHRTIPALKTFLGRKQWEESDPRRRAARDALFWVIFSPVMATVATGGFLITLFAGLTWRATERQADEARRQAVEAKRQSDAVIEQNTHFQEQLRLQADQIRQERELTNASRRAELLATLYDRRDCRPDELPESEKADWTPEKCPPRASARARAEAAVAFWQLEKSAGNDRPRLMSVDLAGARMWRPNLSGATLSLANLSGTHFWEANLSGATLVETRLPRAEFVDADLSGARLWKANLSKAELSFVDLSGADLGEADLSEAGLMGANLSGAVFLNADLTTAALQNANLSGANLEGADCSGASLPRANLFAANLRDTTLCCADLFLVENLRGVELDGSRHDAFTRWPEGFDPIAAGSTPVAWWNEAPKE